MMAFITSVWQWNPGEIATESLNATTPRSQPGRRCVEGLYFLDILEDEGNLIIIEGDGIIALDVCQ